MKRVGKKTGRPDSKTTGRQASAVPLIVPHGGAEAGRDFESAFEMLRRDERTCELWHRERVKFARVP